MYAFQIAKYVFRLHRFCAILIIRKWDVILSNSNDLWTTDDAILHLASETIIGGTLRGFIDPRQWRRGNTKVYRYPRTTYDSGPNAVVFPLLSKITSYRCLSNLPCAGLQGLHIHVLPLRDLRKWDTEQRNIAKSSTPSDAPWKKGSSYLREFFCSVCATR